MRLFIMLAGAVKGAVNGATADGLGDRGQ